MVDDQDLVPEPRWTMPRREEELRRTADEQLPALALADDVSRLLAEVIQHIHIDARRDGRTPEELRLHALWFMAIIALRALRAAMLTICAGYEDQAVGYQRLVDELHNRAQKIRGDASGNYAQQWLDGRGLGKGAKLGGQDFWEFMSGPVHANARAVLDWLAVSQPDGSASVVIGPERRLDVANAALSFMAGEGRDIANALANEASRSLDLSELDSRIREAHAAYIPDDNGETSSS